ESACEHINIAEVLYELRYKFIENNTHISYHSRSHFVHQTTSTIFSMRCAGIDTIKRFLNDRNYFDDISQSVHISLRFVHDSAICPDHSIKDIACPIAVERAYGIDGS